MGLIGYLRIRDSGIGVMENKRSRLPPFCNLKASSTVYGLKQVKQFGVLWKKFEKTNPSAADEYCI